MFEYQAFEEEDYDADRWRLAMEMGGLYLQYSMTGKNLLNIMHDDDLGSLENNTEECEKVQFQDGFGPGVYVVWTLNKEAEVEKERIFKFWWWYFGLTDKYGYQWGARHQRNGFIRLGQQVCDPPSDCDRAWPELLEAFAETPVVQDIRFSSDWPYGETESDLRFLYPGDDYVLAERAKQWWFISWFYTPPVDLSYLLSTYRAGFGEWWATVAPSWWFSGRGESIQEGPSIVVGDGQRTEL